MVQHLDNVAGLQQLQIAIRNVDGRSQVPSVRLNVYASFFQQLHDVVHHSALRQSEANGGVLILFDQ